MKKTAKIFLWLALWIPWSAVALLYFSTTRVKAQNTGVTQLWGSAPHTSCPAPVAGQSLLCLASDGLYLSVDGGALTQVSTGAVAGVTSWNGLTGAVTYVPPVAPVSSVNGKTGVVVLAIQ